MKDKDKLTESRPTVSFLHMPGDMVNIRGIEGPPCVVLMVCFDSTCQYEVMMSSGTILRIPECALEDKDT